MLTLIGAYEGKAFPIDLPDPIAAIHFRMEQLGITPKDLRPVIGQTNRVYKVLAGKRSLTIAIIRKLYARLGIPAQCLIMQTQTAASVKVRATSKKH